MTLFYIFGEASTDSCYLDQARLIPVTISNDTLVIDLGRITRPPLLDYLRKRLRLCLGEAVIPLQLQDTAALNAALTARPQESESLTLTLNEHSLLRWHNTNGAWQETGRMADKLTVMELRMLGQFPHPHLPYPRSDNQAVLRPRTDLHTHLSSQITAEDLLEAACEADACYPVELLRLAGISTDGLPREPMPSFRFSPAASDGLACEQSGQVVEGVPVTALRDDCERRARLEQALTIPADGVITFDALERSIYRMRNPLTKHPGTIAGTIARVAHAYARDGVDYAELAVTAAFDPDWLEAALPAIEAAEAETGVCLRLLAGVPRALSPIATLRQLDLIKVLADHPYIVGMDFLGYEANKTRNFAWALTHMARWAARRRHSEAEGQDDFILRVHAGENGKNPDNVAEVLQIAARFGVRVRVGHAAYGDLGRSLDIARRLGKDGLVIIEFNPDSNMAMNNIDMAEQLPVKRWASGGVPFVLASDGAGIYQTNGAQLLAAGRFAGLDHADIALLQQTEAEHIHTQHRLYERKRTRFTDRYGDDAGFLTHLRQTIAARDASDAMSRLADKRPLLIAGASGSSWGRVSAGEQQAVREGIEALVRSLDPRRVYFAMGRVKHEGVGRVLDETLGAYLADHPDGPGFDVVGMLSQHQNMPTLAEHINHIVSLSGELMSVPVRMTELLHAYGGAALYIGGSAFTRDFIHCSKELGLPFGVMADASGASAQKAAVLDAAHVFHGAAGMLAQARRLLGDQAFL